MKKNEYILEKEVKIKEAITEKIKRIQMQDEVLEVLKNQIKPYHEKYLNSKHYEQITKNMLAVLSAKDIKCYFVKSSGIPSLYISNIEPVWVESDISFSTAIHDFNGKFKTERLDVEKMTEEIDKKIQMNIALIKKLENEKKSVLNVINSLNEKIAEIDEIAKNITSFTCEILRQEYVLDYSVFLMFLFS